MRSAFGCEERVGEGEAALEEGGDGGEGDCLYTRGIEEADGIGEESADGGEGGGDAVGGDDADEEVLFILG